MENLINLGAGIAIIAAFVGFVSKVLYIWSGTFSSTSTGETPSGAKMGCGSSGRNRMLKHSSVPEHRAGNSSHDFVGL